MTEQYRAVLIKADTLSKDGTIYTADSLRAAAAAEESGNLHYDEETKELYVMLNEEEYFNAT